MTCIQRNFGGYSPSERERRALLALKGADFGRELQVHPWHEPPPGRCRISRNAAVISNAVLGASCWAQEKQGRGSVSHLYQQAEWVRSKGLAQQAAGCVWEGPEDLLSLGITSLTALPGSGSGWFLPTGLYDPDSFRADRVTWATTEKKSANFWGNSFGWIFYILKAQQFQHVLGCELLYHLAVIEFKYFTSG